MTDQPRLCRAYGGTGPPKCDANVVDVHGCRSATRRRAAARRCARRRGTTYLSVPDRQCCRSEFQLCPRAERIVRLIGVYDADSTIQGEVAYWIGARLGRRHCSLCDITHGSIRQRPEWTACRAGLPVPFDTFHRNDQPDTTRATAEGRAPVVVAETDVGHVLLLSAADLDACGGSVDRLVEAIDRAAASAGLAWATPR